MGEIAEMMLDGTLCEGCGEYIGRNSGFPQYCSPQCAKDRGDLSSEYNFKGIIIGKKAMKTLKWMEQNTDNYGGMYPGIYFDDAPSQISRLITLGLAEHYYPHNDAHKTRAIITSKGRAYLREKGKDVRN